MSPLSEWRRTKSRVFGFDKIYGVLPKKTKREGEREDATQAN